MEEEMLRKQEEEDTDEDELKGIPEGMRDRVN